MIAGEAVAGKAAKRIDGRGGARANAGRKSDVERESNVYADYNAARAKREMHNANLAELEERQRRGELVERSVSDLAHQQLVANAKARLLAIPSKAAPAILGLTTVAEVQAVLRDEIYQALEELAGASVGR